MSTKGLQSNIWKFTIFSITNKRTYLTFLTIFLLTMPNATAKTIGAITAVGQFVGFIIEVPSGYISDRIGHKNALIIARTAMVLSTACYVFATSSGWFFVGGALVAIGFSFTSGTASAFMHDTLQDIGKSDRYAEIMGRIKSIGFAVPIIFIITLPMIAEINFRWAFTAALIIDIVGLFAAISLIKPTVTSKVKEVTISNFKETLHEWYNAGWFRYVIVAMIVGGISFGATAGFKNPYQELIGFSISSLGLLWATSRAMISSLLLCNGWMYKTLTFKQFMIIKTFVRALCFTIIGISTNIWFVAFGFIFITVIGFGTSSASSQFRLEFIKKSKSKATLLSVNTLFGNLFSGLFGLIMGVMVAGYSYMAAYLITGCLVFCIVIFAIFYLPNRSITGK